MNKKLLFTLTGILIAFSSYGTSLSPEEALQRAEVGHNRKVKSALMPKLLETRFDIDGNPVIYIFTYSGDEGFMLVSADDAVTPLLGYSENNSFALRNPSPEINSWLSYYEGQIRDCRDSGPLKITGTRFDKPAIEPMIKTKWDQNYPYNSLCPSVGNKNVVTGCVATAMAQVMKYWEYPLKGKGSITFRPASVGQDLTMDFSATEFDWANMQNSYKAASATSIKAVATLMKACGYSVRMDYGLGSSGAKSDDIDEALVTYFGYDSGVKRLKRSNYSNQDDWNEMIYNELATIGPIIYSGQSTAGGHCFVCDGYDGNGMFHINWGWGGLSDGYFVLNDLSPSQQGTGGGSSYGFNAYQGVIVGIMPPVGRLTMESLKIDNAELYENVKGIGYTYKINEFSNIKLSIGVKVTGGRLSSPLYITIYETDPETKNNIATVYDSTFEEALNTTEGSSTYTTRIKLDKYDTSKLYTLNVSYDLKNQRTTIGTIRFAASSGIEEILTDSDELCIIQNGREILAKGDTAVRLRIYDMQGILVREAEEFNPAISLDGLPSGIYIGVATTREGESRTLKLHLK